jgi:hypothetical protein
MSAADVRELVKGALTMPAVGAAARQSEDPGRRAQLQEAERACLGAQLCTPALIGAEWMPEPEHYSGEGHAEIAAALRRCGDRASPDNLCEELFRVDALDAAGGWEYIEGLTQALPSRAALQAQAGLVRKKARGRQEQSLRAQAAALLRGSSDTAEVLAEVRALLDQVEGRAPTAGEVKPRILDLRNLAATPPPERTWFIRDWLGPGPTLFAASGGVGKSLLAQQAGTALAIGRSFIGEVERPLRNLVWACEDDIDELARRQIDISRHFDIDPAAPADNLILQSRLGMESMLMTPWQGMLHRTNVFEELRQQVNDLGVEVLWLDNVAHLFGGDEVNRGQVTSFISALAGLVTGRPFSVVLLSHVARQMGSEFAGSAAWENAVRMRWYLGNKLPDQKAEDADEVAADLRFLAKRKTNYSQRDYVRFRYAEGALLAEQAPGVALASYLDEKRAEQLLVGAFQTLKGMGFHPTAGKTSPEFLPGQAVAKGLAAGYGKKELSRALDRLIGRGIFYQGPVGQYANRAPKQGLILKSEV